MDHLVVDRDAGRGGEPAVAEEGRNRPMPGDEVMHDMVNFRGGNAGAHRGAARMQGLRGERAGLAHLLKLLLCF